MESLEQLYIDRLTQSELPLLDRAIAFRSIIELRGCTARELATFFGVDPRVVVIGLSLLELSAESAAPQQPAAPVKVPSRSRASHSRVA